MPLAAKAGSPMPATARLKPCPDAKADPHFRFSKRRANPARARNARPGVAYHNGLDRVVGWSAADCDPAQLGEFFEGGFAAEAAVTAVFYAAEGHLRLVVNGGAVDVADACLHLLGEAHRFIYIAAEDGAREAVLSVI